MSAENCTLSPEVPLQRVSLAQYDPQNALEPSSSLSCLFPARAHCSSSTSHESLLQLPTVASCLVTVTISHTVVSPFPADCSVTALSTDLPGSSACPVLV